MPWARIDDSLCDHPKTLRLVERRGGLASLGLFTLLLSWCNRHLTDGVFTDAAVRRLGGQSDHISALVECGFVETAGDGWQIHDFGSYSKSKERVTREREGWRQRQMSRRDNGVSPTESHGGSPRHVQ
jgi:hypothetical protein